jgi:diacylglycerol kinase family enzyme
MAKSDNYLESAEVREWRKSWSKWYSQSDKMLRSGRIRPILLCNSVDKETPFLFELQKQGILAEMVSTAITEPHTDLDEIIQYAQSRAEQVWRESKR